MDKTFERVAGDPSSTRARVLTVLRDAGPSTRADLARGAGLAAATLTGVIRDLLSDGAVVETGPPATGAPRTGPRGTAVALNPAQAYALGVDVGFRTFRVMVCDAAGHRVGYAEQRLEPDHDARTGVPLIGRLADRALADAGCSAAQLSGAGVALRGPVDSARQRVVATGELAGWAGVSDRDVAAVLGCPVLLENDANLAALGEHVYGAGRGLDSTITVKLHSGIGAGLIVNNTLVTGHHGAAGELGHVPVTRGGAICRCGKRGCLDTRASLPAILTGLGQPTVAELLARLAAGEPKATSAVAKAGALVGRALVPATLLLAPQRIIVVGALARAGDAVLDPIRGEVAAGAMPGTDTLPPISLGALADRPTVLGALALVLRRAGWLAD